MLRRISKLMGYKMAATDGEIGRVHDFFFDDQAWVTRYLVVDTGRWLPGRRVLLAPEALGHPDAEARTFAVSLTREQIENSPPVAEDKPVSQQQEIELYRYFSWTPYWGAAEMYNMPAGIAVPNTMGEEAAKGDSHLRSVREVDGYHLSAADGNIGHVSDFLLDDADWTLRYAVADTRNWLPGKYVLVATHWFKEIDWAQRKVFTDLKQEAIRNGPHYDPHTPMDRETEAALHRTHDKPAYWE